MHEYKFVRDHQKLKLSPKAEEHTKEDSENKEKSKADNKKESKMKDFANKIQNKWGMGEKFMEKMGSALDSTLKRTKVSSYHNFNPYILVERIDGSFHHDSQIEG